MAFGKRFPKDVGKSFPKWVEVRLSREEEKQVEEETCRRNLLLMQDCIADAKLLFAELGMKGYQNNIIRCAVALFEKMATHTVYAKEAVCKDRFDSQHVKG